MRTDITSGWPQYRAEKAMNESLSTEIATLRARVAELERELALRPTQWAYKQACDALWKWRAEAKRLSGIEIHREENAVALKLHEAENGVE